jgi:hypothetical protein
MISSYIGSYCPLPLVTSSSCIGLWCGSTCTGLIEPANMSENADLTIKHMGKKMNNDYFTSKHGD